MTRDELVIGGHYWYREYHDYRVVVLDLMPYNTKASASYWHDYKPVPAKSKTALGVYVQYVDLDTGDFVKDPKKSGQHMVGQKRVVSIKRFQSTWDVYADVQAEKQKAAAEAQKLKEQGSLEKMRLNKLTELYKSRLSELGLPAHITLQDYGALPGYSSFGGKDKPQWRVSLSADGEDQLAFIVMQLEEVSGDG